MSMEKSRAEIYNLVEITVIPMVKNVGKPCEGKLHARFDEEGLANPAFHSTIWSDSETEVMSYLGNLGG
jgi:hypothetical protein